MYVPPRRTNRRSADWDLTGERPTRPARQRRSDKVGLALVWIVTVAVLVAVVLLVVL